MQKTNIYHLQLIANRFEDGPDCPVATPIRMAVDEITHLRAEFESARIDKERLDWLEKVVAKRNIEMETRGLFTRISLCNFNGRVIFRKEHEKLRAAIDAARGGK